MLGRLGAGCPAPSFKMTRKEYMAAYYQRNKEKLKARSRAHYANNKEQARIAREKYLQTEGGQEARKKCRANYKAKRPEVIKAGHAISNAIRDGRLTRPEACWHCGNTPVEAHHSSYAEDMRLAVTWLCTPCHNETHRMVENV